MNGRNGEGVLFPSLLSLIGYGLKVSKNTGITAYDTRQIRLFVLFWYTSKNIEALGRPYRKKPSCRAGCGCFASWA
jgi:hypothetical protein